MTEVRRETEGRAGDLLSPTLQHRAEQARGPAPWRLSSQVYVAFFGGSLAVAAIAVMNARRHAMPARAQATIAAIGVVTFIAVLIVASVILAGSGDDDTPSGLRVAVQLVSVAGWGLMFLIQRPHDRVFEAFGNREHASLVLPGLAAVLLLGSIQFVCVLSMGS